MIYCVIVNLVDVVVVVILYGCGIVGVVDG